MIAEPFMRDGKQGGGVLDFGGRQADLRGLVEVAEGVLGVVCQECDPAGADRGGRGVREAK